MTLPSLPFDFAFSLFWKNLFKIISNFRQCITFFGPSQWPRLNYYLFCVELSHRYCHETSYKNIYWWGQSSATSSSDFDLPMTLISLFLISCLSFLLIKKDFLLSSYFTINWNWNIWIYWRYISFIGVIKNVPLGRAFMSYVLLVYVLVAIEMSLYFCRPMSWVSSRRDSSGPT